MSKKVNKRSQFLPALLKNSFNFRKEAQKKSKVSSLKLERDRNRLQEKIFELDRIFMKLKEEEDPQERQKLLLYFQVLSTYVIAAGQVHLSDYLCVQFYDEDLERKNPKTGQKEKVGGVIRSSIGELIFLLNDTLGVYDEDDEEDSIFSQLEKLGLMTNDIGVSQGAFRDENGKPDPNKYIVDKAPTVTATPATEEDFEEGRGITADEMATEDKVAEQPIPDLRKEN